MPGDSFCRTCNRACLHLKQEACQPSRVAPASFSERDEQDVQNSLEAFVVSLEAFGESPVKKKQSISKWRNCVKKKLSKLQTRAKSAIENIPIVVSRNGTRECYLGKTTKHYCQKKKKNRCRNRCSKTHSAFVNSTGVIVCIKMMSFFGVQKWMVCKSRELKCTKGVLSKPVPISDDVKASIMSFNGGDQITYSLPEKKRR